MSLGLRRNPPTFPLHVFSGRRAAKLGYLCIQVFDETSVCLEYFLQIDKLLTGMSEVLITLSSLGSSAL